MSLEEGHFATNDIKADLLGCAPGRTPSIHPALFTGSFQTAAIPQQDSPGLSPSHLLQP
jgi:hypothetical protein